MPVATWSTRRWPVVRARPEMACPPGPPVPLLQVAVKDDGEIPYAPGDPPFSANGVVLTPVTSEVSAWRQRDGCASGGAVRATGSLQLQQWVSCQKGSRVELATYASGGHYWPAGNATTPPAGQIVWQFVNAAS